MARSKVRDIDRGYKALVAKILAAKQASVEVGITNESGAAAHKDAGGKTILEIATYHEFGIGVPQRSFIRGWFDVYQGNAQKVIAVVLQGILDGQRTLPQALELIGVRFVAEAQKYMITAPFTPLAESTIRRKGSSLPLVDTGQMKASITYRIRLQ